MKNLILFFISIVLIGCSVHIHNGKLVTSPELVYKNGLYYYYGKLYSGNNYEKYDNDRIKLKSQFKNGKKDGDWIWYNEQGFFKRRDLG